jgi:glyoxylase-like metal-dependent hydrolase (beta-lactamase superfamily II)
MFFGAKPSGVRRHAVYWRLCRVDLPNSNPEEMHDSLTNKLMRLDDNTILYPGHNYAAQPTSTIGEQRRTNPYCQPVPLQQFLRMMGR